MSDEITTDSIKPGQVLGAYEIVEEIGRGGMGIVYKAHETALNRTVALKVMPDHLAANPGFVQRFTREAQSAAALHHSGIVTVYSVGKHEKIHYIAMEFVQGATLADVLEVGGPLEVPRALEIAAEICEALTEAHEKGIIHRDIKPHNIMLDERNRAKMTDFGLAKAVNDNTLTTAGFILGTPTHMAPEQCNGQPADHRSDLYSVGVVLYEMLTGNPPFSGETPLSLMRQIADMPFPNIREQLPEASEDVARIIETFTAKDPADRYQSGAEAAADLRAVIGGQPVAPLPAPKPATRKAEQQNSTVLVEAHPAYQQARRGVRRAMIIGAVLALVFVLVLWGSIRLRRAMVDDTAASPPVVWETPEVSTYSSPFDEPEPEPAATATQEPLAPAGNQVPANELPPELQDRVRTGPEPEPEPVATPEPDPEPVPASTTPESTLPTPQEVKSTVQKVNEVLKQVDDALGGGSSSGKGKGNGKGKGKKK